MRVVKGLRDTAVLEQHLKQTLQVRLLYPEPACHTRPPSTSALLCCKRAALRVTGVVPLFRSEGRWWTCNARSEWRGAKRANLLL